MWAAKEYPVEVQTVLGISHMCFKAHMNLHPLITFHGSLNVHRTQAKKPAPVISSSQKLCLVTGTVQKVLCKQK